MDMNHQKGYCKILMTNYYGGYYNRLFIRVVHCWEIIIIRSELTWLGKWMYNPATQVQVYTDANLGSYFQKNKIAVGASPTAFPFKKNYH
jgi:hypothetical protein